MARTSACPFHLHHSPMNQETRDKLIAAGRADLVEIHDINQSGYAGVLSNGNIVDRRKFPSAIPVPANSMLGIPPPKPLPPTPEQR